MVDHSENALRAVVKSLRDVIGPAVDPQDPLAQQELALSIGYLVFLRDRLPEMHTRARFELMQILRTAQAVREHRLDDVVLSKLIADSLRILADPSVSTASLQSLTADVSAQVASIVRAGGTKGREVELEVVECSAERIGFERAWHLPMGFDPDPASAPTIAAAVAAVEKPSS